MQTYSARLQLFFDCVIIILRQKSLWISLIFIIDW